MTQDPRESNVVPCDIAIVIPRIAAPGGAERQALRLAGHLAEEGLDVAIVSRGCAKVAAFSHPAVRLQEVESSLPSSPPSSIAPLRRAQNRWRRKAGERSRTSMLDSLIPTAVRVARLAHARENPTPGLHRAILALARIRAGKKSELFGAAISTLRPKTVLSFLDVTNLYAALALMDRPGQLIVSYRNDPRRSSYGDVFDSLRYLTHTRADVVGANSAGALEALRGLPELNGKELVLTPNIGVAPSGKRPSADLRRFLVVGRMVDHKRPTLAVRLFAEVAERLPGWELHFIGDGPERIHATALARELGVADHVLFHGFVDDVPAVLAAGGVLLHLSEYEGTPNVVMEAMAAGIPSLVTDASPGPVELIRGAGEDGGIVCGEGDLEGIASSMVEIASDAGLRERLGDAARRRAAQMAWPALRDDWLRILDVQPR